MGRAAAADGGSREKEEVSKITDFTPRRLSGARLRARRHRYASTCVSELVQHVAVARRAVVASAQLSGSSSNFTSVCP